VRERWKQSAAVVAAIAVAEAAAMLLRPRTGLVDPAPVKAGWYFSPAEIDRVRSYRRPQRALFAGMLAVQGAVLGRLAKRPPRLPPAASGAALALSLSVAPLPLAAIARRRAVEVGLVTQSWGGWSSDVAKSLAIGAVEGAAAGAGVMALVRRFGPRWWLPGAGAAVATGTAMAYVAPVVLAPMFNRFTDLPPGPARDDVLELAGQAGLNVGRVLEVDGSRRTTAANAYVTGLGHTKRVVLNDTLIANFTRSETRLVVAHELAHVRHRDIHRQLAYLALTAPAAAFAVAKLAGPNPTLPGLTAASAAVLAPLGIAGNRLSRVVERRADTYALQATGDSDAFIDFQRRITLKNVADPDPPRLAQLLLGTHPTTLERMGLALAIGRSPGGS
jgi:Zn-dependent protease with chaperone function